MQSRARIILLVVVLIIIGVGATAIHRSRSSADTQSNAAGATQGRAGRGARGGAANRAVTVLAEKSSLRDLPVYLRGLGTVTPYYSVTLHTRVDGQIMEVNFREGQDVKKGQLLVLIDPRPYEVQLHQAEATLAKDQAQLEDAQLNYRRYADLFQQKIIPQQQVDTQRALVDQLQGTIGADKAQVENAKLQLLYCHITAPISGRIGLRLVDPGNIVHASDTTGLLVITQLQPITVVFTLPANNIDAVLRQMRQRSLSVDAYTPDNKTKIASGKLLTLNNEIDTTTGTNKFKAVFDNQTRVLWPNEFVNVWLLLETRKNALTVPVAAVQRGPQGTFVYVVKSDNTVEARTVKTGVSEGNYSSIESGLSAGETVVTDGQDKLQPGGKVEVQKLSGPGSTPNPNAENPAQGHPAA